MNTSRDQCSEEMMSEYKTHLFHINMLHDFTVYNRFMYCKFKGHKGDGRQVK